MRDDRTYPEEYRTDNRSIEEPELAKDKYGYEVSDINIPSKFARDYIGYCVYNQKYEGYINERIGRLQESLHFLNNACDVTIIEANISDVKNYVRYLGKERKNREGTITHKLTTIGNLIAHIYNNCNIDTYPNMTQSQIQNIDLSEVGYIRPDFKREPLSRDEVMLLIESAGNRYVKRDTLIIYVLYETGIRNSDLRNLKIKDVKLDDKLIFIWGSKGDNQEELSYKIPIQSTLARKLRHWIDTSRESFLTDKKSEYIFPSQSGGMIESNTGLNHIVLNAAENAGLSEPVGTYWRDGKECTYNRVTPHVLRHSLISHLDDQNVNEELLKIVLGNEETLEDYRHRDESPELFDKIRIVLQEF